MANKEEIANELVKKITKAQKPLVQEIEEVVAEEIEDMTDEEAILFVTQLCIQLILDFEEKKDREFIREYINKVDISK